MTAASVGSINTLTLRNAASFSFSGPVAATTLTTFNEPYTVAFNGGGTIANAVQFLNTGTVTMDGTMTFTGGVNTITGDSHPAGTILDGTVQTAGQPITLGSVTLNSATTLDTTDNGASAAGAGISLATVTGDGQNLALDAGTSGAVTTASISGANVLTLTNAASFTFSGPVTATTLTASNAPYTVTFEGGGTITNSVLFFKTGTVTLGTNPSDVLTFLGGLRATIPAVIIDGTVQTAGQPIALGNVTLSGASTLDTTDNGADPAGAGISLATVTGDGQNLALDAGTGGAVTTASIGGVDVLTLVNAASFAFNGPVTATTLTASNAPYTVAFNAGGTITNSVLFFKTGTVTLGTNPSDVLTFLGGLRATIPAVIIDGTVQTAGQPIALGNVTLSGASTLDTTDNGADPAGAGISLATVTGDGQTLTLNAGTTGTITASGTVNNVSLLTIANSGGTSFQGTLGAGTAGAVTLTNTTGTIAFQGDTHITTLTTAAQDYNVTFGKAGTPVNDTVDNAVTFLNAGTLTLGLNASDVLTFTGGLTATAPAVIVDGTISTAGQPIVLGSVTLSGATTLDATDNGANVAGAGISLATVTGDGQALTLNAGTTGTITVSGAVNNVSLLTIANSGGTSFQGTLGAGTAGAVTLTNTTGTIAFQGDTHITTLTTAAQAYNVTFGKAGTPVNDTVDNPVAFLNTGTLTLGLNTSDVLTFTGGLTATAPAVIVDGAIPTAGQPIVLGSVTLSGATALDATDNGANVAGAGISLAMVTGDGQTLTLNAGTTGTITASGAVNNVSLLTIANSGGASFQGTLGAGTAGAVTLTNTTGTVAFQGDTHITTLTTAAQAYNVTFGKAGTPVNDTVDNAVTFLNAGTLTLGLNASDVLTFTGGLTATAPAVIVDGTISTRASRSLGQRYVRRRDHAGCHRQRGQCGRSGNRPGNGDRRRPDAHVECGDYRHDHSLQRSTTSRSSRSPTAAGRPSRGRWARERPGR